MLLPALAVSACAPTAAPPSPFAPPLRLVGTEPFWAAEVTRERIRLSGVDRATLSVAIDWKRSRVGPSGAGFIADGPAGSGVRDLGIVLEPGPCSDGMSDQTYAFKARVAVFDASGAPTQSLEGCAAPLGVFERERP